MVNGDGKSRIERHRLVNEILAGAFDRGLQTLAINACAPGLWVASREE
jgi:BolA family transcriptional regulator, general stress-responsive regulator